MAVTTSKPAATTHSVRWRDWFAGICYVGGVALGRNLVNAVVGPLTGQARGEPIEMLTALCIGLVLLWFATALEVPLRCIPICFFLNTLGHFTRLAGMDWYTTVGPPKSLVGFIEQVVAEGCLLVLPLLLSTLLRGPARGLRTLIHGAAKK